MRKYSIFFSAIALTIGLATPVQADVNWRQFEGTTLNAAYFTANYIDAWFRPMAKQFEKETGIKVRMEVLQAGQIRKKQDIMLAGQDPQLDIVMLQMDNRLQGNKAFSAPEILPTKSGIGKWKDEQLSDLFRYGELPDGDYVADHMAEVVDYSTSKWNDKDLQAVINYLRGEQ